MFLWWNDVVISFIHELKSWTKTLIKVANKRTLLEFLLKKDNAADFNTIDSCGFSPIEMAIEIENVEIIKLLIRKSRGGDLNIPS